MRCRLVWRPEDKEFYVVLESATSALEKYVPLREIVEGYLKKEGEDK